MTGLRKHLSRGKASGGHDMPLAQAQALALQVAAGSPPVVAMAPAAIDEVLTVLHQLSDESAADFLRLLLVNLVVVGRVC
jgi:ABC-type histidine transport system ATPase subunit